MRLNYNAFIINIELDTSYNTHFAFCAREERFGIIRLVIGAVVL